MTRISNYKLQIINYKFNSALLNSEFIIFSFIISFIIYSAVCGIPQVNAQEMNSQNFKIQGGNLNLTAGSKASTNYRLTDVVGQTVANTFTSKGYVVNAGFLNSAAAPPFLFTVSPAVVDFGILSPAVPVERSITLFI